MSMFVLGVIVALEMVAAAAWIVVFIKYDARIAAWEDRKLRERRARICRRWLNAGDLEAVTRYGK